MDELEMSSKINKANKRSTRWRLGLLSTTWRIDFAPWSVWEFRLNRFGQLCLHLAGFMPGLLCRATLLRISSNTRSGFREWFFVCVTV